MRAQSQTPRIALAGANELPEYDELFRPAAAIRPGVEIVERRYKDGGRQHVEDHDIDVRVSFDQSKHRHPLPGWCASCSLRASLDPWKFRRGREVPVVYFMRREGRRPGADRRVGGRNVHG